MLGEFDDFVVYVWNLVAPRLGVIMSKGGSSVHVADESCPRLGPGFWKIMLISRKAYAVTNVCWWAGKHRKRSKT